MLRARRADDEDAAPVALKLLVRRESRKEPPNYYVVSGNEWRAVTSFSDPAVELTRGIRKQLLHYERETWQLVMQKLVEENSDAAAMETTPDAAPTIR